MMSIIWHFHLLYTAAEKHTLMYNKLLVDVKQSYISQCSVKSRSAVIQIYISHCSVKSWSDVIQIYISHCSRQDFSSK